MFIHILQMTGSGGWKRSVRSGLKPFSACPPSTRFPSELARSADRMERWPRCATSPPSMSTPRTGLLPRGRAYKPLLAPGSGFHPAAAANSTRPIHLRRKSRRAPCRRSSITRSLITALTDMDVSNARITMAHRGHRSGQRAGRHSAASE